MTAPSDPSTQPGLGDSGPDTVRILPEDEEDAATRLMDPDDPDFRPLQKGTLYTPAPQVASTSAGQGYVPYDPSPLSVQSSSQPRQMAIETVDGEAGRLARSDAGPPAVSQPVIIKKGPSTCALVTVCLRSPKM